MTDNERAQYNERMDECVDFVNRQLGYPDVTGASMREVVAMVITWIMLDMISSGGFNWRGSA